MADQSDPHVLALAALAATLGEERRAQRFLDLSGIGIAELRQSADDSALLAALLGFLEGHEPDLVAVAREIGVEPGALVAARHRLEDEGPPQ